MGSSGGISVDVRTRGAGDGQPVDAGAFFGDVLPALFRDRADLAVPGARHLGVRPLAIEVDGSTWHLSLDDDALTVGAGDGDARTLVRLTPQDLADLVHDVVTPVGLFSGGTLDQPRGRFDDLLDWWVVLRSVLDGRRAHVPGDVTFHDRDGGPLDLGRSFGPGSDPAEQAHFLAEAGFLHLTGVFTADEMAAVSAEMDDAAGRYSQGDGRSWWVKTNDGADRLVRMQHFQDESATTAALIADDRLTRLGDLFVDGHRFGKPGGNKNLVEGLFKPIGVADGISDVPWHKDCSLGGHAQRCSSMTVGISVTGADADSGQLRVVAGSNRALVRPAILRGSADHGHLPELELPTATGDVTVHLSCTLHMAQPPVTCERRVLYTDLRLPSREGEHHRAGESRLRAIREAAPTTVSQEPSPVQA